MDTYLRSCRILQCTVFMHQFLALPQAWHCHKQTSGCSLRLRLWRTVLTTVDDS